MKRLIAFTAVSVLTAVAPAWATVIDLGSQPGLTASNASVLMPDATRSIPIKPKQGPNSSVPLSKEEVIRRQCAVARYQHDRLYKAGVPDADIKVDVRAACEPDKVSAESTGKWLLVGLGLVAAFFMLPLLFLGMAPG